MTPAAPSFENCLPKVKFRTNQRRHLGAEQTTTAGMKKISKITVEHRKTSKVSDIGAEGCDGENYLSKGKQDSLAANLASCSPSTSGKFIGDSHIEVSDEDGDNYSSCPEDVNKGKNHSVQRLDRFCKDVFSLKEENSKSGEAAFGDDYSLFSGHSARNFYVVKSDGRPAEMFRTDLFDKLRKGIDANQDSDDEYIPGNGLIRMTDRWRAEWSNGIQVPLGPSSLSGSGVRKTVLSRDSSIGTSIQRRRRQLMKKFFAKPFGYTAVDPLRLYECTALDKQWLKLLNEHLSNVRKSPLSMEMFLEIMNDFEIECYKNIHRKLLEPLHSPSSRVAEQDDETPCDICRVHECEPDDEMVFCDGCNLCVHMSCYGLQELPAGEWLCMKCRLYFGLVAECGIPRSSERHDPPCVLCPTIGGALKCVDESDEWAHVVCALWLPECRFVDAEKREGITSINQIKGERWVAKCAICDTRQGACIKCTVDTCKIWFHATCALRSGLEMRIEQNDPNDEQVNMISLCPRHHSARPYCKKEMRCEPEQAFSDEEGDDLCSIGLLRQFEQTCYLYASHEETAARLKQDPLIVAAVFEFWRRKRLHLNNGRPLIDNLQDEIRIGESDTPQLELPICTVVTSTRSSTSTPVKRAGGHPRKYTLESMSNLQHALVKAPIDTNTEKTRVMRSRLLSSLQKGKELVDLVLRRCLTKHLFMTVHLKAIMVNLSCILLPVPLSRRKIAYFNETLKVLCSKSIIDRAENKAEEISNFKEAFCVLTNSGEQFDKSASPSSSLVELSHLSLQHTPRSQKKLEERHDEMSLSNPSCRSQLNGLLLKKRKVKQENFVPDQLKDEGNIRRSLRSWKDHSIVENEETVTVNSINQTEHRNNSIDVKQACSPTSKQNHCLNSSVSRELSGDEMAMNEVNSSIECNVSNTVVSLEQFYSIGVNKRTIHKGRQSESKKPAGKVGSPLRKRRRTVAETTTNKVALLEPLDSKDFDKNSEQRLRRFTIDRNGEMNKFRVLRSRCSLPSINRVDHLSNKALMEPKNVTMSRFHSKRRSRHRDDIRRPKGLCTQ